MNLAQLGYVVALDEHRHFSRAAEACDVTQPTLSTQLGKLERELGVEIFDRTRRPVEPTDLGRRIVAQARRVLREAGRMEEVVREARGVVAGELRVGILPTLAPYLLPRFVYDLTRTHPGISLTVEELVTDRILEGLATDRIDAGLVATPVEGRRWIERELFVEPFVAYLAPDHRLRERERLRRDDVELDDLWLLHEGHCFRDQVLELCDDDVAGDGSGARPTFRSGNIETLRRLVDGSGGMTLLPALAAVDLGEEESRRLRPFVDPPPSRVVRLVHGKTYLKRSLIRAFAHRLLEALPTGIERRARPEPSGPPPGVDP